MSKNNSAMSLNVAKQKATAVSRECFGGILHTDANGFYSALEFFALCQGCHESHGEYLPSRSIVKEIRPNHVGLDYARRVAWGGLSPDELDSSMAEDMSEKKRTAIGQLLESLQVPVPGRKKKSVWNNSHFLPYVPSSIHWDARKRGSRVSLERIYYRGAGSLLFSILRDDKDLDEFVDLKEKLGALLSDANQDNLEILFATLKRNDFEFQGRKSQLSGVDEIECQNIVRNDYFESLIRKGTINILSHDSISRTIKFDALLHFLPLGLIRLQYGRAKQFINGTDAFSTMGILDFGMKSNQIRRESKRGFDSARKLVLEYLKETEFSMRQADPGLGENKGRINQFRDFFARTASAIGLLNSYTGVRHFTLGNDLIETLVLAETKDGGELTLGEFCTLIHRHWGLVVDRDSARKAGLLTKMDAAVFESNTELFAERLKALGFLEEFSDQTRVVRYGY